MREDETLEETCKMQDGSGVYGRVCYDSVMVLGEKRMASGRLGWSWRMGRHTVPYRIVL